MTWPSGIGVAWQMFTLMAAVAIILNTWWLLKGPGRERIAAAIFLFLVMVGAANLADAYSRDWVHRNIRRLADYGYGRQMGSPMTMSSQPTKREAA